jgi:hypothetical protein
MKELKDIPKDNPFRVPENYFAELEGRIIAATKSEKQAPVRKGFIIKHLPGLAVAASVALMVLIGYSVLYRGNYGNGSDMIPEITVNDFTDIYLNDIDLRTLEDKVAESGLFIGRTGVSKGDIIDYLVSENIDVFDIYENL